jgi:fatty acid desaturase
MRLRHAADVKTMLWVLTTIALCAVSLTHPSWALYLWPLNCYFALTCGVIAHNHNHCPTFAGKRANAVFGDLISIFYGYPTFAWIPTHNLNHHKFVNRAGDATITWRHTNRHNALVAITYPFISAYYQAEPTNEFIAKAKTSNPKLYKRILRQYVVVFGTQALLLTGSIYMHGWKTGLLTWSLACLAPAIFALWTIMWFNYVQHVHTDPWSEHNHSRSFVGFWINFFLFNNGYHAVHHENPGTHWSKLAALHDKIDALIDPRLKHRSMWGFAFRQYLLAPLFTRLGTEQVGRAPFVTREDVATGSVDAAEEGDNAAMLREETA